VDTLELRRQAVHAAGLLSILPLLWWGKWVGAAATGAVFAFFVIWALWRHNRRGPSSGINTLADNFMSTYERSGERPLMGAITFYAGATIAIVIFSEPVAAAAIAVLALADSLSTVVGYYFGRHKLPVNNKKSWEGSATFFLTALAILLFFVSPLRAFCTALIAMAVEALPRIDDNISIPLAVGALLTALAYFNI
jgi:dolichol kinase